MAVAWPAGRASSDPDSGRRGVWHLLRAFRPVPCAWLFDVFVMPHRWHPIEWWSAAGCAGLRGQRELGYIVWPIGKRRDVHGVNIGPGVHHDSRTVLAGR